MNNEEKNLYVRQRILNTLLELIENGEESVSVIDLVRKAGVGRASFYRNYSSTEDVLRQEYDRLMTEWSAQFDAGGENSYSRLLVSLLDFYRQHGRFYAALYRAGLSDIVMSTIVGTFHIDADTPNAAAYRQSSLAYMIYGWIHEWIQRGMQESGSELVAMIEQSQMSSR